MKKFLVFTLALVLTVGSVIGGTVAYLTSTDSDVNVMTLGNVEIEQIEQERDENGSLVDFTQNKPAYPAVGPFGWADNGVDVNGTEYKVFTDELKNVVDKIVTVKNTGKSDAFVRTIVAIEAPGYDPNGLIQVNFSPDGLTKTNWAPVDIDGVQYVYSVFTYTEALKPEQISTPSLMQLFLDSKTTNEDVAKFGESWEVMVVSQAVQAAGFSSADVALDEAFGDDQDTANVIGWFTGLYPDSEVEGAEDLNEALGTYGRVITLNNDVTTDTYTVPANGKATINLNGNTLTGIAYNSGDLVIEGNGGSLEGGNGGYNIMSGPGSSMVFNDVNVLANGGGINAQYGAEITFNSGSVSLDSNAQGQRYCFYAGGAGTVITVNDGDFSFEPYRQRSYACADGAGAVIYIKGGNFGVAPNHSRWTYPIYENNGGEVIITGGTFGFNPTEWVADGYEAVQSGSTWTVSAK